ncbi:hypothetical protein OROGR_015738 [Orobanche gracilis]
MSAADISKYGHSPVHAAVISKDYAALRKIISALPRLLNPSDIHTELVSATEEAKADAVAAIIDLRDHVPNRDTPLHLAVKLSDGTSTEILMLAGADWSLQNAQGWSPLQEAICSGEEKIAKIIVRHCQPLSWAKWCRRLPRLIGTVGRMRDFYMEINFRFESSVVPFVSKIAPSDTYKIWKRGANLRADTTMAGFDGLRIQRSDQSFLFLGDGPSGDAANVPPGSLLVVSHRNKEVLNAMDGAGGPMSEDEVEKEVSAMSRTNIFRPGIDVTQAVLLPQTTWRKQEKIEMVGPWRAKVYDMHNVVVSVRSREVPGVASDDNDNDDDEPFNSYNDGDKESETINILTEEERKQLESALKMQTSEVSNENDDGDEIVIAHRHSCYEQRDITIPIRNKGRRTRSGNEEKKMAPPRSSLCVEDNFENLLEDSPSRSRNAVGRHSTDVGANRNEYRRGRVAKENGERKDENEYKKGLRPTLCLSSNFPLQTEELLPLLDILANKVKAIRRLRELLTTKLPKGTFPVKVAIPVVPTIRVIVTFTKFEELQPSNQSLSTTVIGTERTRSSTSSSWFQWIKSPYQRPNSSTNRIENIQDPFAVPTGYKWTTVEEKKRRQ